jgi:hypothetical protein
LSRRYGTHPEPGSPGPSGRLAIVVLPCPGPFDGANHMRAALNCGANPAVSLPAELERVRICCNSARRRRCSLRLDRVARVRPRRALFPGGPNGSLPKLPALSSQADRCQQNSSPRLLIYSFMQTP